MSFILCEIIKIVFHINVKQILEGANVFHSNSHHCVCLKEGKGNMQPKICVVSCGQMPISIVVIGNFTDYPCTQ